MSEAIVVQDNASPEVARVTLTAGDMVARAAIVQEVMEAVMKDGEHYGVIPGCGTKPTLLNPGAQKLAMTFQFAPSFDITKTDLGDEHREYEVKCRLVSIVTGQLIGEGVGSCSTLESKYRWRNASDYEDTGDAIPDDYKAKKQEYRKQGLGAKNVDGQWLWVRYKSGEKVPNPDIADTYNTVLKMAKKRAFIDAVLTATAASDMFTQDLEDLADRQPAHDDTPRATAAQATAIDALFEDLGWDEVRRSNKLAQAGVQRAAQLTEDNAARLIVNLGDIVKRKQQEVAAALEQPDEAAHDEQEDHE